MTRIVYLNGNFVPESEAKISADDRGFNFADGVYEVVKYYNGKPFRLGNHLLRLERSLAETKIRFHELKTLPGIFNQLLAAADLGYQHAGIYLQISRGSHPRVHHLPADISPTVYAVAFPFTTYIKNLQYGIRVITAEDIRWMRCDIKSVALLPNTILFQQAVENGADETILIRNGKVTEATHSSVLGLKKGMIRTHPLSNLILPGITRKVILEICESMNIRVSEEPIAADEIFELDELMIAGTGSEIMPVIQVDRKLIGNGKPGPLCRLLQQKFFQMTYGELAGETPWWNWD